MPRIRPTGQPRWAEMWDVFGAIKEVVGAARDVMHRVWGGRTREQDRLERELVDALEIKRHALAEGFTDTANHWDAVARRLRDEIRAKYPGG